jgi:predicted  nucleic acid-binding Zn-ribbon protein
VRSKGKGDFRRQLDDLNAIITYAQDLALEMEKTAAHALNTDPRLTEENARLREQINIRDRTIAAADRQLKGRMGEHHDGGNEKAGQRGNVGAG